MGQGGIRWIWVVLGTFVLGFAAGWWTVGKTAQAAIAEAAKTGKVISLGVGDPSIPQEEKKKLPPAPEVLVKTQPANAEARRLASRHGAGQVVQTKRPCRLRTSPSTAANIQQNLDGSERLVILAVLNSGWYQVKTLSDIPGYIRADLVEPLAEAAVTQSRPDPTGRYSDIDSLHWINENSESGYRFTLEDGSVWEVEESSRELVSRWRYSTEVRIRADESDGGWYIVKNEQTSEEARVRYAKAPAL